MNERMYGGIGMYAVAAAASLACAGPIIADSPSSGQGRKSRAGRTFSRATSDSYLMNPKVKSDSLKKLLARKPRG